MLKSRKFWKKLIVVIIVTPLLLFTTLVVLLVWKQDKITQELITALNKKFVGEIEVGDSHISPFVNFPYISIDIDNVKIYEDKTKSTKPILNVKDIYLGFDILTLMNGDFEIKSLKLKDGFIHLIQHTDGEFNISKALSDNKAVKEDAGDEFHLNLKSIDFENIDLTKLNEENNLLIDLFIDKAKSKFKTSDNLTMFGIDSHFQLSIITNGDTTFIKHKDFYLQTQLDYNKDKNTLTIHPSEVKVKNASFGIDGSIDLENDCNLDLKIHGNKPNFDLFIAFAPEELITTLQKYKNQGTVFFEASVIGKSIHGHNPLITADFGCANAFFNNIKTNKKVDKMHFKAHFTNGKLRNKSTMEFSLIDFYAKPEAGAFSGYLKIKNFDSPEIDMKLLSEFDLDFLSKFLNLTDLQDLKGQVALTMNFRDIIDLENPEKSIEKLNESYYTELKVTNLSFKTPHYHLPFHDININAVMDGHEAKIERCNLKVGKSDISISGSISDLPAILHHTANEVKSTLSVTSTLLDIEELTSSDVKNRKAIDEQIENLSFKLQFKSSAKAFTESPHLPVGEFFIEDLYAKMKHYPHTLHDFNADVFIEEQDFKVIDFSGILDKSDFHFTGKLKNYGLWFDSIPKGDTKIEFDLTSKLLQLEDVFAYGGENYVPEDYRHEELKQLKLHGHADLHFNKALQSSDIYLEQFEASAKVHPMRIEKFKGNIHYEDEHLKIEKLSGQIGKSKFIADLNYYFGTDKTIKKRDNHLTLKSSHLDFDELFNYNPPPVSKNASPVDHEAVFNIYKLPFTDMTFDVDISHLNYHRFLLNDLKAKIRIQENHYIYIDTLSLLAAGGKISIKGYFNGSDSNKIYFSPDMRMEKIDLDKLMFKFENFGQDHLVSENLHGKLSGKLTGTVRMHADMTPIIDKSELHLDIEVLEGRLEHYGPIDALSDYFKDKNLKKIMFDTLSNHIDIKNGELSFPAMTINSSLGFIDISGKQDMNLNMEYYLKIPWKMVTQVGVQKLFGKKEDKQDPGKEDEIQYKNNSKNVKYLNLKITGTPDNYKISQGKAKS